jgi:general nucleoside transport system permease protein
MDQTLILETIRSVIAGSSPLVLAGIGEMLNERAGVVNLSLDGSILLAAMAGFAAALLTGSLTLGFALAMIVGSLIALLVAFSSIVLYQDQIAIGFVLTLLMADLSSFVGQPYVRRPGPSVPSMAIPGLARIPYAGTVFFDQNLIVYASYILVVASWVWLAATQAGLQLRSVGERPEAAYARGINVNRLRFIYTAVGGALVGAAGAAYSLNVKLGWSHRHTAGMGWIALAIVIFGGWHPLKIALGAYLFGALKSLGSLMQPNYPNVPTQVFQAAPFAFMILALLLVSRDSSRIEMYLPSRVRPFVHAVFHGTPPASLGQRFEQA